MSYNKSKVPEFRFLEFQGDWKEFKIGNILTIGSGRDYKHLEEGSIPVFGSGGLMTKVNDYLYDGETVCIGRKGTIDKPMYFNGKIWTVDTLFYTHSFHNSLPKFIYYLFLKINWKQHNEAGGVPSLSKSIIEKIQLVLPSLPEQQKIASFLTAIDTKIVLLNKKKSLLEQYKKGVMQQIFSQKIRFKDDNEEDFPKWEVKKLKQILTIGNGRDYRHLGEGDIPVFGTGGLMTKVDDYLYDGETVCIGRKGTIDRPMYFNGKIWTVDTLFYTHSFVDVLPKFVYILFLKINWKQHNEAGGVPSLSKSTIEQIYLSIPTLPEQTKISDFLFVIDNKINMIDKQLEFTKTYKKGLLQQLFV
ncbi:restriction endonuclease subunit S [Spirosoma fluviale]|uniref:Type I restriction enzyme, S subunit n=1 Tax=Spirosoma fluviale TaxID=1597977 RepID=A0A286FCU2_9BACT|nr:restriction endonuclease subunit S [Spirosoma fluviale]SOD81055.1 type I restriction enzyme, S subunit [Spirosoma fluviale]